MDEKKYIAEQFSTLNGRFYKIEGMFESFVEFVTETFKEQEYKNSKTYEKVMDVQTDVNDVRSRVRNIERDMKEIKETIVPPMEFEDLNGRVSYIEKKMGIVSGK